MATISGSLSGGILTITSTDASDTDRIIPEQLATISGVTTITVDSENKVMTIDTDNGFSTNIIMRTFYDDTGWTYNFAYTNVANSGGIIRASTGCDWISGSQIGGEDIGGFTINTGMCSNNDSLDTRGNLFNNAARCHWYGANINFNSNSNRLSTGSLAAGSYVNLTITSTASIGLGSDGYLKSFTQISDQTEFHLTTVFAYIRTGGNFNGFTSFTHINDLDSKAATRIFNQILGNFTITDYAPTIPTLDNTPEYADGVYKDRAIVSSAGILYKKQTPGYDNLSTLPASDTTNWLPIESLVRVFNASSGAGQYTITLRNPKTNLDFFSLGSNTTNNHMLISSQLNTNIKTIRPDGTVIDNQDILLYTDDIGGINSGGSTPELARLTRTDALSTTPTVFYTNLEDEGLTDLGFVEIQMNKYGRRHSSNQYFKVGYLNGSPIPGVTSTNQLMHSVVKANKIYFSVYKLGDTILYQQPYTYDTDTTGEDVEIIAAVNQDVNLSTPILTGQTTNGSNLVPISGLGDIPTNDQLAIYLRQGDVTERLLSAGNGISGGNLDVAGLTKVSDGTSVTLADGNILSVSVGYFPTTISNFNQMYDVAYKYSYDTEFKNLFNVTGTTISPVSDVTTLAFSTGAGTTLDNGTLTLPLSNSLSVSNTTKFSTLDLGTTIDLNLGGATLDANTVVNNMTGMKLFSTLPTDTSTDFSLGGSTSGATLINIATETNIALGDTEYFVFHPDFSVAAGSTLHMDANTFLGGGKLVIINAPKELPAANVDAGLNDVQILIAATITGGTGESDSLMSLYKVETDDSLTLVGSTSGATLTVDTGFVIGDNLRLVSSSPGYISVIGDIPVTSGSTSIDIDMLIDPNANTTATLPNSSTDPRDFIDTTDSSINTNILSLAIQGTSVNAASSQATNRIINSVRGLALYNLAIGSSYDSSEMTDAFILAAVDQVQMNPERMILISGESGVRQQLVSILAITGKTGSLTGPAQTVTATPVGIAERSAGVSSSIVQDLIAQGNDAQTTSIVASVKTAVITLS